MKIPLRLHGETLILLCVAFAMAVTFCVADAALAAEGDLVWVKSAGGAGTPDSAVGASVSVLPDGTAFVTGVCAGHVTFGPGESNETILTSEDYSDDFVARYTPHGTLEWAKRITGLGVYGRPDYGVAALPDGGALVTGSFEDSVTLGEGEANETTFDMADGRDGFLAKYNADGTLAWAKQIAGTGRQGCSDIAALPSGGCLVVGWFDDPVTFAPGEANQTTLTAYTYVCTVFVARYDSNGSLVWAKHVGGGGESGYGERIAALSDGGALVTGHFGDATAIFGPGDPNETTLTCEGWQDAFVAKYNPSGTLAWVKRVGGAGAAEGTAISALSDGSGVVTGSFYGSATFGQGESTETTLTAAGSLEWDIFVAKYNSDGTLAWAKRAGCAHTDASVAVEALSDGSVVLAGSYRISPATFGEGEPNETVLTCAGWDDMFVAKYASDGALAWARRAGGTDVDLAVGVAALADGGALVTGCFGGPNEPPPSGTATFGEGEPNETMLTSEGGADLFLARFEGWKEPDLDTDGLPDAVETDSGTYNGPTDTGTDPHNPDTDGDGLNDGDEVRDLDPEAPGVQNPFHPLDPDTTGDDFQDTPDGVPDGQNDYDGDGQSNAYELLYGSNPLDASVVVPGVSYLGVVVLLALLTSCGLCYLSCRRLIGV
jgi:hypothetical protein